MGTKIEASVEIVGNGSPNGAFDRLQAAQSGVRMPVEPEKIGKLAEAISRELKVTTHVTLNGVSRGKKTVAVLTFHDGSSEEVQGKDKAEFIYTLMENLELDNDKFTPVFVNPTPTQLFEHVGYKAFDNYGLKITTKEVVVMIPFRSKGLYPAIYGVQVRAKAGEGIVSWEIVKVDLPLKDKNQIHVEQTFEDPNKLVSQIPKYKKILEIAEAAAKYHERELKNKEVRKQSAATIADLF